MSSRQFRSVDVLIDRDGKQRVVLKIEQEFVSGFLVHNLTIDEDHTFAVGPDALLVHNTAKCFDDLVAEAKLKYPKKAALVDENHHVTPQYLGGPKDGPTAKLPAAYHQEITNAFRDRWKYGQGKRPDPGELQRIMDEVYSEYPLGPG